jgi:hypothetical protein
MRAAGGSATLLGMTSTPGAIQALDDASIRDLASRHRDRLVADLRTGPA